MLLGGEYAVNLKSLENRLMKLVDGAGIDMLDIHFFQQCHGFDARAEVLADCNNNKVDIFKG